MSRIRTTGLALLLSGVIVSGFPVAVAQNEEADAARKGTAASVKKDLEDSMRELADLRESIASEKLPMNRKLRSLENELVDLRAKLDDLSRELDQRNLDLGGLKTSVEAQGKESEYLSNLLDEYVRNFEPRVHITELQRYRDSLEKARLAPDGADRTPAEVFGIQTDLVETSLERLEDLVGGTTFEGTAIGEGGRLEDVRFALIGPVAVFRTEDGSRAGLAEQRLGSLEPNMIPLEDPQAVEQVKTLVASGSGILPFDATLGNAQKIEATQDTLIGHIEKGGPVMIPILILALAAFVVAVAKYFQLMKVRTPSKASVQSLLESVRSGNYPSAIDKARTLKGPAGEMIRAGLDHIHEPKELVEEVMFERMLETRLRLQSFLSFVAVSAAAAPLLGLLGTVTGIINTFKLITVFGTGDAKTLSSGISEALITTEFGLIVAIPSLLLHAFLSRKSRRLVDGMEKTAVSFLNRLLPSESARREQPSRPGNGADTRIPEHAQPLPAARVPAMASPGPVAGDH